MNDPLMEDVGFGAGEGLDFLEDFGEVNGLEDLDKEVPLEELDETLKEKETEQEAMDKSVAEAVAQLTGEMEPPAEEIVEEPEQEAVVPEQPTGDFFSSFFRPRLILVLFFKGLTEVYKLCDNVTSFNLIKKVPEMKINT